MLVVGTVPLNPTAHVIVADFNTYLNGFLQ